MILVLTFDVNLICSDHKVRYQQKDWTPHFHQNSSKKGEWNIYTEETFHENDLTFLVLLSTASLFVMLGYL